ncbi:MAG: TatD family hydrolase [Elusimicrobia bacterium]|nr:TatD family hydrolase [Elusimicrobiota bacterium]
MLFDTHAHLSDRRFDPDRGEVLARAREALGGLVEIADAPAEWDAAMELAEANPGFVWCTLGLHPYHAEEWEPELAEDLKRRLRPGLVVAVGEVGLDYAKCEVPRERQKEAFEGMLGAADAVSLPVVIHCREAYGDLLPILRMRYAGRKPSGRYHGVVHCFSGNAEEAAECAALGFALGADGPVTYPKNDALRAALAGAGLGALVLETDSPWLPPQPKRGKRCEPADVADTAEALAAACGVSRAELERATWDNARELYRLPSSAG